MTYDLYNFLSVEIRTRRGSYRRFFRTEYGKLLTGDGAAGAVPRIRLHIVKNLPDAAPGDIARRVSVKKLFTASYLVRNLPSDTVDIFFREHWIDRVYVKALSVFAQTQVLEPIMYAKLLEQKILFLHGAGVSDGTHGSLFPARGGTGKTTLSLNLARRGFEFLGDDLLLVDYRSQTVYPYPRPLHLFGYNIDSLNGATVDLRLKGIIKFKDILRRILERATGEPFLISTRVDIGRLYPRIRFSRPVRYRRCVFLRGEGGNRTVALDSDRRIRSAARDIIDSSDLNGAFYDTFRDGNEGYIRKVKQMEKEAVTAMLRGLGEMSYVDTGSLDMRRIDDCIPLLVYQPPVRRGLDRDAP